VRAIEEFDTTETIEIQFHRQSPYIMQQVALDHSFPDTHLMSLPFDPELRSPSRSETVLPELSARSIIHPSRSETVDEDADELIMLPDVTDNSDVGSFFDFKKRSFREAEMLIVIEDIKSSDSVIPKGEKLQIVRWMSNNKLEVKGQDSDDSHEIELKWDTVENLMPYAASSLRDLQMFTLSELLHSVHNELRVRFDDNIVEVIKDFIQLRPRYFQEHQNVGGRLMLFPVASKDVYNDLVVRDDGSYEMKHVLLLEDGTIHCPDREEIFDKELPGSLLTNWAFVKYKDMWKVVLMTDDKQVREMLDFHEVFQDPTRDVLLPLRLADTDKFNSNASPRPSNLDLYPQLQSEIAVA